ncbi:MAG TPA: alpha/beta hydrolase [Bryobacteraceae bacterium]|jgi:fermentation-respiration switch protein FrsA (DUF1100 family)|nr:alpha/beta hydrolase [Bryobacteraceae bacterium]
MSSRKRILWFPLAAVVLTVSVLAGVGWIGSERAIHPKPAHYRWELASFPDLHPQNIQIQSRTGIRIAASFFPGTRQPVIVLSHGYGDNRTQMLPWAEFLHRHGYNVLTYDMRDRGGSGGNAVTLGALEPMDLISAVDYVASRPGVDRNRIGALGLSLGGAVSILSAARDSRIRAVVDDSGFSDAPRVISSSFEHFIGLPAFPFAPITVAISEVRTGQDISSVRPVDVIARISPRPVLILHCQEDQVVPPGNSERNFQAAREPKEIWRIPTGGHIAGHTVAREEYERRVTEFFDRALGE